MARIRTIKPEFFTSEDIVCLSPHARLLYIGLWCEADKEGRLVWKLKTLKMRYLPSDDVRIEEVASELVKSKLVLLYGDIYAYIPAFRKHQHVNPRESVSRLPSPEHLKECSRSNLDFTRANLDLHAQGGREEEISIKSLDLCAHPDFLFPPKQENQKPTRGETHLDPITAAPIARRLVESYRRLVAPSSTPRLGEREVVALLTDAHGVNAEKLTQAIRNFAEFQKRLGETAPFPPHASRFFQEGIWEEFADKVPEIHQNAAEAKPGPLKSKPEIRDGPTLAEMAAASARRAAKIAEEERARVPPDMEEFRRRRLATMSGGGDQTAKA